MSRLEFIRKQREMQAALQDDVKKNLMEIRGQYVILDSDVAKLYGVETRVLNQAVKRNAEKFPSDYMYRLTKQEVANLQSQNVTANIDGITGSFLVHF